MRNPRRACRQGGQKPARAAGPFRTTIGPAWVVQKEQAPTSRAEAAKRLMASSAAVLWSMRLPL